MIASYQERRALEQEGAEPKHCPLATIAGVYADGVTLIFDGEKNARARRYPYNAAINFSVGQRIRIEKIGGVYVAAYPIAGGRA